MNISVLPPRSLGNKNMRLIHRVWIVCLTHCFHSFGVAFSALLTSFFLFLFYRVSLYASFRRTSSLEKWLAIAVQSIHPSVLFEHVWRYFCKRRCQQKLLVSYLDTHFPALLIFFIVLHFFTAFYLNPIMFFRAVMLELICVEIKSGFPGKWWRLLPEWLRLFCRNTSVLNSRS